MSKNRPTLAFFFELNGSLELWDSVGFLQREISLYNRLAKEYFEKIYFFTYGNDTDLKYQKFLEPNIIIIPLKRKSRSFFKAFLYELAIPFFQYSTLKKCDFIKTNQNSGSLAAAITKTLFPKKNFLMRSGYVGSELARRSQLPLYVQLYYFFEEHISYRLCDYAFIPAIDNAHLLLKKYPFLQGKISVHNNFINTNSFKKTETEKCFDIIYVGRMNKDKNHQAILHASKNLSLSILFIGDGEEKNSMLLLAENLHTNLKHIASVPNENLPDYYNKAKICVFPSLHEGNPKALLEAMACELPIVALDAPGVSNIVRNEINGLIGKESELRSNINRLLNDVSLRDKLGKEARKTVLEGYDFEKIIKNEIDTYHKLLNL